ncbi:MAG: hypothetical protein ACJ8BW_24195, partial [Ktedonobacteraceae bacterium]
TAYHAAFLAASALALIAAFIGLAISDREAAPSMQRQIKRKEQGDRGEQVQGAKQSLSQNNTP